MFLLNCWYDKMDDVTERLNAVTKKLENWQRTNGRENHEGTQKTAEGGYKAKAELFRNGFFEIALTAMITAFIVHWLVAIDYCYSFSLILYACVYFNYLISRNHELSRKIKICLRCMA